MLSFSAATDLFLLKQLTQEKHSAYAYINGPPHFIGYAELLCNVTECIGEQNSGGGRYNRVTCSHGVQ